MNSTLRVAAVLLPLLLVALVPRPSSAQTDFADPTCAACLSKFICTATNNSGVWSTDCRVGAEGCEEAVEECVIGMERAAADLQIPNDAFYPYPRTDGAILLAPVGDGRYAAWTCGGELAVLVSRRGGEAPVEMDPAPYRNRYRYSAMVSSAGSHGHET